MQIRNHHKQRSKEILDRLGKEKLSAYELASRIRWNIGYSSWEDFPIFQKYFAMRETLAHLKLLEEKNLVRKVKENQIILYYTK